MTKTWKQVDEEAYFDALGVVPPAFQSGNGFLMGEPVDHRSCEIHGRIKPTFHAYIQQGDRFLKSASPLTVAEFIQASIHPQLLK
jgi:hypothetical protein